MYALKSYKKYVCIIFMTVVLSVLGALVAAAPELMIRFSAFSLFVLLCILAAFGVQVNFEKLKAVFFGWLICGIAMFALWPAYAIFKLPGMPAIEPRRLYIFLSLLVFSFLMIGNKEFRVGFFAVVKANVILNLAFLSYFIMRFLSCFASDMPVPSIVLVFWEFINYGMLYFICISVFHYYHPEKAIIASINYLSVIVGLLVLVERAIGANVFLALFPLSMLQDDNSILIQSVSRIRDGFFRAQGTFEHPLVLAEFAVICFCFSFSSVLAQKRYIEKSFALVGVLSSLYMIYASGSRSGLLLIAIAAISILFLWMCKFKQNSLRYLTGLKIISVLSGVAVVLMLLYPVAKSITDGQSRDQKASSAARAEMMQRGVPAIFDHPIIGSGIGQALPIAGVEARNGIWTLDNQLLGTAIESGVICLMFYVTIFVLIIFMASKKILYDYVSEPCFCMAIASTFIALLINRAFIWVPTNMTLALVLMAALVSSLYRHRLEYSDNSNKIHGVTYE